MESSRTADDEVKTSSVVWWHRIFGLLAVLHAAGLLWWLVVRIMPYGGPRYFWEIPLWVGLCTLWFLWPIVLALHPAASGRRIFIPLGIAAASVYLWFRWWAGQWGPEVFNLPEAATLMPLDIARCAYFYTTGYVGAKRAIRENDIALEGYGFGFWAPRTPNFSKEDRERCGIKCWAVTGCLIDSKITSHANGWNDAMMREIRRRYPAVVKAAEEEDVRFKQSYFDGEAAGRADAEKDVAAGRLSIEMPHHPTENDTGSEKVLRDRYQIELKRVYPWADPKMANYVGGHSAGYNGIAEKEINRRFGENEFSAVLKTYYANKKLTDSK